MNFSPQKFPSFYLHFLQTALCFAIAISDLNHIQVDSRSEVVNLRNFLPEIMLTTVLPSLCAFSGCLAVFGLLIEVARIALRRKCSFKEMIPIFPLSVLSVLHCIPETWMMEREDLYVLQLGAAVMIAVMSSVFFAVDFTDQKSSSISIRLSDASVHTAPPVCEMLTIKPKKHAGTSTSTALHNVRHSRCHSGRTEKRQRPDTIIPDRIGKAPRTLKMRNDSDSTDVATVTDFEGLLRNKQRRLISTKKPFILASSRFQRSTPSVASFSTGITEALDRDDIFDMASCRSPSAGSAFTVAPSTGLSRIDSPATSAVSDDDTRTLSLFSSLRYCPSTVFYAPSALSSSAPFKAISNSERITSSVEWSWKVIAGIVLLFSISMNAVALWYLLRTKW